MVLLAETEKAAKVVQYHRVIMCNRKLFSIFRFCVHARDCTTNSRQVSLNRTTGQIMRAMYLATRHDLSVHAKNLTTPMASQPGTSYPRPYHEGRQPHHKGRFKWCLGLATMSHAAQTPCVQGGSLSTHRHHSLTRVSNVLGIASPHKDLSGILRSSKDIS